MHLFVIALHVVLCLFLILIIILQPGKGGDVGAAFGGGGGGGGQSFFGPRGPANLLSQATTVVAILFMVTSITLSLYSNRKVLDGANVGEERERLEQERRSKAGSGGEPLPIEDGAEIGAPPGLDESP